MIYSAATHIRNLIAAHGVAIFKTTLLSAGLVALTGCMYSKSYPKPEYIYSAKADDAEFTLESDFGTDTQFSLKISSDLADKDCYVSKRVAYLQAMDSYFRNPDAPGPWQFATPAKRRIVVTGYWFQYGNNVITAGSTSVYAPPTFTTTYRPGSQCSPSSKTFIPSPGGKYRVRLHNAGQDKCELSITTLDGAPVADVEAGSCSNSRRRRK